MGVGVGCKVITRLINQNTFHCLASFHRGMSARFESRLFVKHKWRKHTSNAETLKCSIQISMIISS